MFILKSLIRRKSLSNILIKDETTIKTVKDLKEFIKDIDDNTLIMKHAFETIYSNNVRLWAGEINLEHISSDKKNKKHIVLFS